MGLYGTIVIVATNSKEEDGTVLQVGSPPCSAELSGLLLNRCAAAAAAGRSGIARHHACGR